MKFCHLSAFKPQKYQVPHILSEVGQDITSVHYHNKFDYTINFIGKFYLLAGGENEAILIHSY